MRTTTKARTTLISLALAGTALGGTGYAITSANAGPSGHEFPAKVDLNGRQQIGQSADAPGAKVDIYRAGQQVPFQCQAAHQGSLWIKTTDNVWVPDQYVTTGTDGFVEGVERCGEDDGSLGGGDGGSQSEHQFPAKVDLNGRQQIGQSADAPGAKVDIYRAGQQVPFQCQAAHQGSLWIKTTDNVWVPDQYVTTGTDGFAPGVDKCGEDDGSLNGDGNDDGGSGEDVPEVDGLPGAPEANPHGGSLSQAPNLTSRAKHVKSQTEDAFGRNIIQCDPSGYRSGEPSTSNHNTGNALDCPVGNEIGEHPNEAQRANGWKAAKWLQQHAETLQVHYVIWDGKIWSASRSSEGWRHYSGGTGVTTGHYDHLHISIQNPNGDGGL